MHSSQQVYIFGGAKGIGRWLALHLFHSKVPATVLDTDARALGRLPGDIEKVELTPTSDWTEIGARIAKGAWVILATPPLSLAQLATDLLPHLEPGVLVIQCASVQAAGEHSVRPHVKGSCTYIGFHPLFGPTVLTPIGQIAVLTEFRSDVSSHCRFRDFINGCGLITTTSTAKEHDEAMLFIQVLTHFCLLCFARSLTEKNHTFLSLKKFRTPPFNFMSAFAGRLLKSTASTVAGIQAAEGANRMRELFISSAKELHERLSTDRNNPEAMTKWFEELRAPFGGDEIDEAHSISEMAVEALSKFDRHLHTCLTSRQACFGTHRDTKRLIVGMVEAIREDEVVLRESILPVRRNGNSLFAVALNAVAEENYKKLGIHFPSRNRITVKKRKLRLMAPEEIDSWLRANSLYLNHQRSFENPLEFTGETLEDLLPQFVPALRSCLYVESYKRRGEAPRATLALEVAPWVSLADTCTRIDRFLRKA